MYIFICIYIYPYIYIYIYILLLVFCFCVCPCFSWRSLSPGRYRRGSPGKDLRRGHGGRWLGCTRRRGRRGPGRGRASKNNKMEELTAVIDAARTEAQVVVVVARRKGRRRLVAPRIEHDGVSVGESVGVVVGVPAKAPASEP